MYPMHNRLLLHIISFNDVKNTAEVRSGAALDTSFSATVGLSGGEQEQKRVRLSFGASQQLSRISSDRAPRLPRWGAAADRHTVA